MVKTRMEVRTRILAAAGLLFDRYGPLKTTVADIAREAGMSPANIYNFFKSREDIIEAVGEIHLADLKHTLVRGLSHTKGSWDGICYLFCEHARALRSHLQNEKDLLQLQFLVRHKEWQFVRRFQEFFRAQLEDLLQEGVASKEFGDISPAEIGPVLFDCMINAMDPLMVMKDDPIRHERQIKAQLNLLKRALR